MHAKFRRASLCMQSSVEPLHACEVFSPFDQDLIESSSYILGFKRLPYPSRLLLRTHCEPNKQQQQQDPGISSRSLLQV